MSLIYKMQSRMEFGRSEMSIDKLMPLLLMPTWLTIAQLYVHVCVNKTVLGNGLLDAVFSFLLFNI